MIYSFFATRPGFGPLFLRFGLAIPIFPHGAQKALGWFGGSGFEPAMDYFTNTMGFPYFLGLFAIAFESIGAIGLVLGLFTRLWATGIGITLTIAAFTHLEYGFFMNWWGDKGGEGFEYHILAVGMSLCLAVVGAGSYSMDREISHRII
ncbi:DoxX family protein [Leptospira perolatii]|uniref:DoxX family protein n=1 Tax=Leptospira perolatii TaxID=2023191 RepID=A0A2M9ZIG4_9LEPT|nr:DoxX family protein [Leptospira perolatii]PJZ68358.1 DoxX family protein [Leptospira perolatii]PJZ71846.1 DoxX family protein [Leptospira perolatii]